MLREERIEALKPILHTVVHIRDVMRKPWKGVLRRMQNNDKVWVGEGIEALLRCGEEKEWRPW